MAADEGDRLARRASVSRGWRGARPSRDLQLLGGEPLAERVEDEVGVLAVAAESSELAAERRGFERHRAAVPVVAKADAGVDGDLGRRRRPSRSGTRSRSGGPRRSPGRSSRTAGSRAARPTGRGAATMLGLHSAAPSMAYSLVKVAPSSSCRVSESVAARVEPVGDLGRRADGRSRAGRGGDRRTGRRRRRGPSAPRPRPGRGCGPAPHAVRESCWSKPSWPGTNIRVMTRDGSGRDAVRARARDDVSERRSRGGGDEAACVLQRREQRPASTRRPGCGSTPSGLEAVEAATGRRGPTWRCPPSLSPRNHAAAAATPRRPAGSSSTIARPGRRPRRARPPRSAAGRTPGGTPPGRCRPPA